MAVIQLLNLLDQELTYLKMAHFAKIGLNSKVIEVQSIANEILHDSNGVEQENIGIKFLTDL